VAEKSNHHLSSAENSLASASLPKGRRIVASEASATVSLSKDQSLRADAKNSDAPKGAGEAMGSVPAKAMFGMPPHQSPEAS